MKENQKPSIYFLINSLKVKHGGLTKACLKQASFFAELGYKSTILTFDFDPQYPLIRKELLKLNKIHNDVIVRNMYEELERDFNPREEVKTPEVANLKHIAGDGVLDPHIGYNSFRLYDNMGIYTKYIRLNSNDSLQFIDYFNENRYRTKREHYDLKGAAKKVTFMDFEFNTPKQMVFLRSNGNAYLSKWVNPANERAFRINWFNAEGELEKIFSNDDQLKIYWLSEMVLNNGKPIVVSDSRSTDILLAKLPNENTVKVLRLHSTHLERPYNVDSNIHPQVKVAIDNIEAFDAALFLTEEQTKDMIERFGSKSNFYTLSHYHEENKHKKILPIAKDKKKAIIINRFVNLKQIDHAIKAFEKVISQVPDAILEIWGRGQEEENYNKLIKELKLENNVVIKGFTHDPETVIEGGLFSVTTSDREGLSLSIMEALANGTPVISYDFKYGPKDLISDKETGLLIQSGDIESLANSMIYLFENPGIAIKMGEKAKKFIELNYNKNNYSQQWLEIIDKTVQNKEN